MAETTRQPRATRKRPVEQYEHDETRKNNPPVGLVTPQTDRDAGGKTYAYDPHIDPSLQWVLAAALFAHETARLNEDRFGGTE